MDLNKADNSKISNYLLRYCNEYKTEYAKLTSDQPMGGGFPQLPVSPYLGNKNLVCLILSDGVVITDQNEEPDYQWWVAGGPALKVDYEPTKTPDEVIQLLKNEGVYGKNIGISRIVSKKTLSPEIWSGSLGSPSTEMTLRISDSQKIHIFSYRLTLKETISRLTFGAFGEVLDIKLPNEKSDF